MRENKILTTRNSFDNSYLKKIKEKLDEYEVNIFSKEDLEDNNWLNIDDIDSIDILLKNVTDPNKKVFLKNKKDLVFVTKKSIEKSTDILEPHKKLDIFICSFLEELKRINLNKINTLIASILFRAFVEYLTKICFFNTLFEIFESSVKTINANPDFKYWFNIFLFSIKSTSNIKEEDLIKDVSESDLSEFQDELLKMFYEGNKQHLIGSIIRRMYGPNKEKRKRAWLQESNEIHSLRIEKEPEMLKKVFSKILKD